MTGQAAGRFGPLTTRGLFFGHGEAEGEAARPAVHARWSLKTEQRATRDFGPSLAKPDPRRASAEGIEYLLRHVAVPPVYGGGSSMSQT